jgi:Family of unknown function (DUF5343)
MSNLPYITAAGNIPKALNAIKSAATPERVSQDFVKTILGISGGSGDQMTSYLKKLGFADSTGTPTDIYKRFRSNDSASKLACAEAIRHGYNPLFVKNEFCYKLNDADLKGLMVEVTGQAADSNAISFIFSCFKHLKQFANFESVAPVPVITQFDNQDRSDDKPDFSQPNNSSKLGLSLSYTINLNLPATSDVAVFNAIFKSLKENLLKE